MFKIVNCGALQKPQGNGKRNIVNKEQHSS